MCPTPFTTPEVARAAPLLLRCNTIRCCDVPSRAIGTGPRHSGRARTCHDPRRIRSSPPQATPVPSGDVVGVRGPLDEARQLVIDDRQGCHGRTTDDAVHARRRMEMAAAQLHSAHRRGAGDQIQPRGQAGGISFLRRSGAMGSGMEGARSRPRPPSRSSMRDCPGPARASAPSTHEPAVNHHVLPEPVRGREAIVRPLESGFAGALLICVGRRRGRRRGVAPEWTDPCGSHQG